MAKKQQAQPQVAGVDPFAVAYEAKPAAPTNGKRGIYVASDLRDLRSQEVVHTATQVHDAIQGFVEGHRQIKNGEALMEVHEEVVKQFGFANFVLDWTQRRSRPDNPKVYADPKGVDGVVQWIIADKAVNINPNEIEVLRAIAQEQTDELIERRTELVLNPDTLKESIEFRGQAMTVQQVIGLLVKENIPGDIGARLFSPKPISQVRKGSLDKALDIAGKNPADVLDFVRAIKAVVSLKAGT